MAIDLGRMRHRVALEAETRAPNQFGEQKPGWSTVADNLPAGVEPISGREQLQADQMAALVTHRVWIRYRQGVEPNMRFRYQGRALHIQSAIDVRGRHELLECMCMERAL